MRTPPRRVATTTAGGALPNDGRDAPSSDTSGYLLESVNLKDGDVMDAWVEGIGELRNPVAAPHLPRA